MTGTITKLPTATKSFIAVRKAGRVWVVEIVTPCEGAKPLRTAVMRASDLSDAVAYAKSSAARMHRPLKLPKGVSA